MSGYLLSMAIWLVWFCLLFFFYYFNEQYLAFNLFSAEYLYGYKIKHIWHLANGTHCKPSQTENKITTKENEEKKTHVRLKINLVLFICFLLEPIAKYKTHLSPFKVWFILGQYFDAAWKVRCCFCHSVSISSKKSWPSTSMYLTHHNNYHALNTIYAHYTCNKCVVSIQTLYVIHNKLCYHVQSSEVNLKTRHTQKKMIK